MAKYAITHTCGHDQIHQLYGPHKDREAKIKWLETTICTDCYKAEKKQEGPKFLVRIIPPVDPSWDASQAEEAKKKES